MAWRKEDVRAFLDRDWALIEDSKIWARAERYRCGGALGCLRAAEALPRVTSSPAQRADDLRQHIEWRLLLDRIQRAAG